MSQYTWLPKDFESMSFSGEPVQCLFCEHEFDLSFKLNRSKQRIDQLRKHLVLEHQFIISDINDIDDLNGYLFYWRRRIAEIDDLKTICAVIKTNSRPEDEAESVDYFMLCPDVLPEDRCLRQELKLAKLNYLTKVQEVERNETDFQRACLFCRKTITGNRSVLFEHLHEVHNLKIGNPNNIVFVKQFLDLIEKKLNAKICLYCEGKFKDWQTLKEHMRKKIHKILNPHNKEYDEFYMINYLKTNQKWYQTKREAVPEDEEEEEDTFDDWVEPKGEEPIDCLFCEQKPVGLAELKEHLLKIHLFAFDNLDEYSFYKKVQIVNYIRSRTKQLKCMNCDGQFDSFADLSAHLVAENHNKVPLKDVWDSSEFYQPVIENDALLRLFDVDDLADDLEAGLVIPE